MTRKMQRAKRPAMLWMGVVLSAVSAETASQQCFDEAPSVVDGGDPYDAIEPTRLDSKGRRAIEKLFERLEGRWSGSSKGYFCRGRTGSARKEADDYRIEMNASRGSANAISLTSNLTSNDNTITRTEKLHLYLSENTLRADRDDPAGDVRILQMAQDGSVIVFLQKVISGSGSAGDLWVRETRHRIQVSATSLTIEYEVYFVGGLDSVSTWKLKKK